MENSKIGWTDHTFNAWEGCTKTSAGCDLCYAERRDQRFHKGVHWGAGQPRRLMKSTWSDPARWNERASITGKTERVFLQSLGDICDPEVPDAWRLGVWKVIERTPHLTWQLLTKRATLIDKMIPAWIRMMPNVWTGVTVEDRRDGLPRIPRLRTTPANLRWLSIEPLLEDLALTKDDLFGIDWVVIGGEYHPEARPMNPHWAYRIVHLCYEMGIPVFFKQWGSRNSHQAHGGTDILGAELAMFPGDKHNKHFDTCYELITSLMNVGAIKEIQ